MILEARNPYLDDDGTRDYGKQVGKTPEKSHVIEDREGGENIFSNSAHDIRADPHAPNNKTKDNTFVGISLSQNRSVTLADQGSKRVQCISQKASAEECRGRLKSNCMAAKYCFELYQKAAGHNTEFLALTRWLIAMLRKDKFMLQKEFPITKKWDTLYKEIEVFIDTVMTKDFVPSPLIPSEEEASSLFKSLESSFQNQRELEFIKHITNGIKINL